MRRPLVPHAPRRWRRAVGSHSPRMARLLGMSNSASLSKEGLPHAWEPVRVFDPEIHKRLELNDLRILCQIRVDRLPATTYVAQNRILGQTPSSGGIRPPDGPLAEAREGILRLSQRDLAIALRAGELGELKWAKVELRGHCGTFWTAGSTPWRRTSLRKADSTRGMTRNWSEEPASYWRSDWQRSTKLRPPSVPLCVAIARLNRKAS